MSLRAILVRAGSMGFAEPRLLAAGLGIASK